MKIRFIIIITVPMMVVGWSCDIVVYNGIYFEVVTCSNGNVNIF